MNNSRPVADKSSVLGHSTLQTAEFLGMTDAQLASVIGKDRSSISRLKKNPNINPYSKTGELALLFIRSYRALFAILGGNQRAMVDWFNTENHALHKKPIDAIQSIIGLSHTVEYLDAMRGKI